MPLFTRYLSLLAVTQLASLAVAQEQIRIDAQQSISVNEQSIAQTSRTLFDLKQYPETIAEQPVHASVEAKLPEEEPEPTEDPSTPALPWLITSPYTTQAHLTNLSTLPTTSKLLTLALTHLSAPNTSYATLPYKDALNWPTVFSELKSLSDTHNHTWQSTTFYVVEFRSKLKRDIDRDLLFKLDRESHREATASGGLLKYWFGKTSDDSEGRNLATCLWREKADAVAGGKGPWHKRARSVIPRMYESIEVKGLRLTIGDGVQDWKFEPWVDSP